ncbi:MAG: ribonuclease E/G [Alphaproteobacteria bacterium]|nr:ribonuclease E/G [Alphaproteobacteria bacterium]
MTKRMLVDATHPEETRVAIVESYRENNRLEDFDFGLASKPILRGNIYLAKVMRIEPSLQAAFVEYGGNRHGFLPFSEIHPDYFRIPVADRPQDEDGMEEETLGTEDSDLHQESAEELMDSVPDEDQEKDYTAAPESQPEATQRAAAEHKVQEDEQQVPSTEPAPQAPVDALAQAMGTDEDTSVGLITDFGNAAVDNGTLTEVAMPEAPPESVGGDVTERIARQHRPRYKIQEVLKRGQVMLIQVVKEERGNKGAALTSFLSLAGRYCVLMPNTDHGGGVSRKITNHQDRRRMKEILDQLEIPEGMAVILRTAGMEQDPPEIQRDLEYLLCMWDNIREQTLQSSAPALIYEEANLIKRSVRDLYTKDINEILIAGEEGFERSRDFMRAIMPDQVEKVKLYSDSTPLFIRYQVENQIDTLHNPVVQLRSGGYLVINPTEALVSIDVNSGRATRERHIEETAVKTNLEAADEIARQLRLRDLAGLVVIDFIDMEDGRNNAAVERRIKEAMKNDRARLQIGRISPFGLLELSRQRLRPSLLEINFQTCPHCSGTGYVRSPDSAALSILRAIEEEAIKQRANEITVQMPADVAVFILNHKRDVLGSLETRYGLTVSVLNDDTLPPPGYKLEKSKTRTSTRPIGPAVNADRVIAETERDMPTFAHRKDEPSGNPVMIEGGESANEEEPGTPSRRRGRGRFRQNERNGEHTGERQERDPRRNNRRPRVNQNQQQAAMPTIIEGEGTVNAEGFLEPKDPQSGTFTGEAGTAGTTNAEQENQRRRRRGRRGGRRRNGEGREGEPATNGERRPSGSNEANASAPRFDAPHIAPPPIHIPTSIHEIDTTPRPISMDPPRPPAPQQTQNQNRSYEVVNPPTEQPKGGWWRKLTGGQ